MRLWSGGPKIELKKARGGPVSGHEHALPERSGCTQSGRFVSSAKKKNGSPGLIRTGGRPINSRMLYR